MIAVDTSVVVAALASWHERHDAARAIVNVRPHLPVHAAYEAYSVLTRLPAPHRVPARVAAEFLRERFAEPWLDVQPSASWEMVDRWPEIGIVGGAIYDAVIASCAARAGLELVTCDQRALPTYAACGARIRLL